MVQEVTTLFKFLFFSWVFSKVKQDEFIKELDFNSLSIQAAEDNVRLKILLVHLKIKDVCLINFSSSWHQIEHVPVSFCMLKTIIRFVQYPLP